jgi:UDP-glucose 4-epimerase
MSDTILVVGGYGFIGAYVVRQLARRGHHVLVIDRVTGGNSADTVLEAHDRIHVEFLGTEVPDSADLVAVLSERGVCSVVNLASPLGSVTEVDPGAVVKDMVDPHSRILDAARMASIRRVVWASSVGVFGYARDYPVEPIPNEAPLLPFTLYGAGKALLERISAGYTRCHGLETIGLRFPLVYGPSRQRGGGQFTTELIEGAALGKHRFVPSPDESYDWMYVEDAARSVLCALDIESVRSPALTVGGTRALVRDVLDLVASWFPDADLEAGNVPVERAAVTDATLAAFELGYTPMTSLRDGVLATANAARVRAGLPVVG